MPLNNAKALNLEDLENISKKVTLGFKCHPKVKLKLARMAIQSGITLSEYVENLIMDLDSDNRDGSQTLDILKSKISFYENETLIQLFNQHKSKVISFTASNGQEMTIKVNEPKDIYTILMNSFKT